MLTSKQRAYLRSLGNGAPVILQVGKGSLGDALLKQAEEAIEARELIKVRVLKACPHPPDQIANQMAESLGAELVQLVGRSFLLYRRSREPRIELPT
ncbi:MAG: YhbY family RNA-binding protein [Firmicutes bacterium]|nr:YhbY family RNA-binding protein [Bacillota bacterium]